MPPLHSKEAAQSYFDFFSVYSSESEHLTEKGREFLKKTVFAAVERGQSGTRSL